MATLILAPILIAMDVGTSTPSPTIQTEESIKGSLGVSDGSEQMMRSSQEGKGLSHEL